MGLQLFLVIGYFNGDNLTISESIFENVTVFDVSILLNNNSKLERVILICGHTTTTLSQSLHKPYSPNIRQTNLTNYQLANMSLKHPTKIYCKYYQMESIWGSLVESRQSHITRSSIGSYRLKMRLNIRTCLFNISTRR